MNTILICPSSRPAVEQVGQYAPLAAVPFLGESLIEYWLTHLALGGTKEVRLLANDRPEQIADVAGNGARWASKSTSSPKTASSPRRRPRSNTPRNWTRASMK